MTALTEEVIVPKQIKIKKSLLFLCKMNIINDVRDHKVEKNSYCGF